MMAIVIILMGVAVSAVLAAVSGDYPRAVRFTALAVAGGVAVLLLLGAWLPALLQAVFLALVYRAGTVFAARAAGEPAPPARRSAARVLLISAAAVAAALLVRRFVPTEILKDASYSRLILSIGPQGMLDTLSIRYFDLAGLAGLLLAAAVGIRLFLGSVPAAGDKKAEPSAKEGRR